MEYINLLKRVFKYDLAAALSCILLPFILLIADGVRGSVSDYAYSDIVYLYVFLLTIAATLITTIGVRQNQRVTWMMGLALMIIPITPHLDFPIIHTTASVIFFGGMSYHIIIYSDTFRKFRWFLVGATLLPFVLYYLFDLITLFVAESIALVLFGINFIVDLIDDRRDL